MKSKKPLKATTESALNAKPSKTRKLWILDTRNHEPAEVEVQVPIRDTHFVTIVMHTGPARLPVSRNVRIDALFATKKKLRQEQLKEVRAKIKYSRQRLAAQNKELTKLFELERKFIAEIAKS